MFERHLGSICARARSLHFSLYSLLFSQHSVSDVIMFYGIINKLFQLNFAHFKEHYIDLDLFIVQPQTKSSSTKCNDLCYLSFCSLCYLSIFLSPQHEEHRHCTFLLQSLSSLPPFFFSYLSSFLSSHLLLFLIPAEI